MSKYITIFLSLLSDDLYVDSLKIRFFLFVTHIEYDDSIYYDSYDNHENNSRRNRIIRRRNQRGRNGLEEPMNDDEDDENENEGNRKRDLKDEKANNIAKSDEPKTSKKRWYWPFR